MRQCEIVHKTLGAALRAAVKAKLIGRDVTQDVINPPRARYGEPVALEPDEVRALLEAAWGTRWAVAFQLTVEAGLFRGELLGLQWRHVDLGRGEIRIVQQVQRAKSRGLVIQPLKTENRRRTVPLTPAMTAALREWRAALARATGVETLPLDGFVFPAATKGYESGRYDIHDPTAPETLDDAFRRYADRAGLRHARFHDLRHTTASWLAAAGVDPATAAKILGHTPRTMLLHYLRSMRRGQTVAREVMASWWEEAAPGATPSSERDAQATGNDSGKV
ncbi:MAG: site-specific integrase [Bacillota bacterium]